jgi:hypothetical protein
MACSSTKKSIYRQNLYHAGYSSYSNGTHSCKFGIEIIGASQTNDEAFNVVGNDTSLVQKR